MRPIIVCALAAAGLAAAPAFAAGLDQVPVGATVRLSGLEAIARSSELDLRRIELVAPGARTYVVDASGRPREVPRSDVQYFIPANKRLGDRFWISLAPGSAEFKGVVFEAAGPKAIGGRIEGTTLRLEYTKSLASEGEPFTCGVRGHDHAVAAPTGTGEMVAGMARAKGTTLHEAVVAIDTDNEFMSLKFSNNTANATTYLNELFAGMNVFYERDLDVRLVRGDTFLRTAADPYTASNPFTQVNEVGFYWNANNAAIDRAFVVFLSGKSPSANSASGIAWVLTSGNYCAATGSLQNGGTQISGHYSATQVFRFAGSNASHDVGIVGHELGHNFGADHTHCTSLTGAAPASTNTIDQCFNDEAECYAGTPSCPTDNSVSGQGSIMSYCNFPGPNGANCGNPVLKEFHPVHQGILDARIATNIANSCLSAAAGVPLDRVFYNGFE